MWDKDGRTCNRYGIMRYPTAYLIGKDGKVIWDGDPMKLTLSEMIVKIWDALEIQHD